MRFTGRTKKNLPYVNYRVKRQLTSTIPNKLHMKMSQGVNDLRDVADKLEKKIEALNRRITELEEKFSKLEIIEKGDMPVESQHKETIRENSDSAGKGLNTEALIDHAKKMEQESLEEDKVRLDVSSRNVSYWQDQGKKLKSELEQLEGSSKELLDNSKELLEALPDELKDEIINNQEGLNIIGRMLTRLVDPGDRLNELAKDVTFTEELKELSEDEWKNVFEDETSEELALKKIKKKLNAVGMENYRNVSKVNETAENRKKTFTDFIGRQVLPILDGINDGKAHLDDRINDLSEKFPEKKSELDKWFQTYTDLGNKLESSIEKAGVYGMIIEPGMKIDFERHEPFGVESDPEMDNEQIKEITRKGYEYTTLDGNRQILRPAQVIVVKNTD
ncbi:MAG: nucleotide exchange factor GrpE [Desulfobacterales bacterium]|nr:nucleotide exchange factor GrpE [Desulfobacterales bacterium]